MAKKARKRTAQARKQGWVRTAATQTRRSARAVKKVTKKAAGKVGNSLKRLERRL
jgi:hypothetical protein